VFSAATKQNKPEHHEKHHQHTSKNLHFKPVFYYNHSLTRARQGQRVVNADAARGSLPSEGKCWEGKDTKASLDNHKPPAAALVGKTQPVMHITPKQIATPLQNTHRSSNALSEHRGIAGGRCTWVHSLPRPTPARVAPRTPTAPRGIFCATPAGVSLRLAAVHGALLERLALTHLRSPSCPGLVGLRNRACV